jgi:lysyl-tRNA synthetase class II
MDLTVNDHERNFIKRTKCSTPCVLSLTRGYLEVETPVLQPIPVRSTPIYHAPQLA